MKSLVHWVLLSVAIILSSHQGTAQRVGVVLSGGGSRGVAHVGFLKALEENSVPIDYIAGTSMGAIIGGMYASGLSPDSIEKIVTSADFQNWARGEIEEEYVYYYTNPSPNASWGSLRFTIDSIIQHRIPTNLVSPVRMDFAGIQYLTSSNVVSGGIFDNLFIPFRCVAADIQEKTPVVFRYGNLYTAIRASMTYPFVFRPLRIDGRLLFDGGIYNNFPVDVMIEDFDPGLVIGNVVSDNFSPPEEDDIRSHIENMLVFRTDYSIPEEKGLVINPDIPPTSVTDFSNAQAFVDSGYVATIKMIENIHTRVKRKVTPQEVHLRREAFQQKKPPVVIDKIFIRGVGEPQQEFINRLLLQQGNPTPLEEIKPYYFRLLTLDIIESINPSAIYNPLSGFFDLYLDVTLNKDMILQVGGNISSSPVNFAFLEAQYKHLDYQAYQTSISTYFGRSNSALKLSGRMDFALKTPVFIESSGSFNYYDYFRSTTTFFQDRSPSYLIQNQNFWEIQIGIPVKNAGKALLGFSAGRDRDDYYQTNLFSRADIADRTIFSFASPFFHLERNTLNRKYYPNRGTSFVASVRYVSGTEQHRPGTTSPNISGSVYDHSWSQIRASYLNYFATSMKFRFGFYGEVFASNRKLFSNYTSSILSAPAFEHVPETRTLFIPNFRANSFVVSGLQAIYPFTRNIEVRLESYIFQPIRQIIPDENNKAYYGPLFRKRFAMLSGAVIAYTPIGPVSLTVNFYDRHEDPFSLSLNFGYLIFNQKALR